MSETETILKERLFFNKNDFNSRLINNMPGIFYAFEKDGEKFFLKKWNSKFETNLGYSDEVLYNMQLPQFFTKKEYIKVESAIMLILDTGSTHFEVNITNKNGQQVPYSNYGYKFTDNNRVYLIGVGMDISLQKALEKKQKQRERKKQKVEEIADANKRELIATAIDVSRTSSTIEYTLDKIDDILGKNPQLGTEICNNLINVKNELKSKVKKQDNWEIFKLQFMKVHANFFSNIKAKHPALTKSELKICAYLRIHLSSAQISSILYISNEGIKKARYRIRKKLNLLQKDSLEDYIAKF